MNINDSVKRKKNYNNFCFGAFCLLGITIGGTHSCTASEYMKAAENTIERCFPMTLQRLSKKPTSCGLFLVQIRFFGFRRFYINRNKIIYYHIC